MSRIIINGEPQPYKRGGVIYEHIYEIELYPVSDTAQFDVVLKKVNTLFPLIEWCYIYHDKDKKDNGEFKKPHYHLLLNFPRERSINRLSEMLSVPLNLIEWKCYLDKSVQYLIHLNDPGKFQYKLEDIEGNSNWFIQFLGGDFTSDTVSELKIITDYIINNREHITFYDLLKYCSEHYLIKTYKQWYSILKDIYIENGKN